MQHERLFALALYGVDDLRIATGTQCRDDHRLRFATGKDGRAVCARQYADLDVDRANSGSVTSINSWITAYNSLTNNAFFKF